MGLDLDLTSSLANLEPFCSKTLRNVTNQVANLKSAAEEILRARVSDRNVLEFLPKVIAPNMKQTFTSHNTNIINTVKKQQQQDLPQAHHRPTTYLNPEL